MGAEAQRGGVGLIMDGLPLFPRPPAMLPSTNPLTSNEASGPGRYIYRAFADLIAAQQRTRSRYGDRSGPLVLAKR